MKKNKKIYLKKIVAVLVLVSVISSFCVIVSSASSVVPETDFPDYNSNIQVTPFFNPVGVTSHYAQNNEIEAYSFAFGGDFYADLPDLSADAKFGFTSAVNVFANLNFISGEYSLRRYNDIQYHSPYATYPNGYFYWGAQYYKDSIDTVLSFPYQVWTFSDFVYSPVYTSYITPFLNIGISDNPDYLIVKYSYKINFYDDNSLSLRTVEAKNFSHPILDSTNSKYKVSLVDSSKLNEQIAFFCNEYDCSIPDYVSITDYEVEWRSHSYVGSVYSMSIHNLFDDRGAWPDMQDYSNWMLLKYQEEVTPPDSSDVSLWLVSGVKGFLDTPLFGSISIGMIFLSIFGFWFLIMFLKKFAGG